MVKLVLTALDDYIPNWQNNPYYLEGFKGSELNDLMFYYQALIQMTLDGTLNSPREKVSYSECLEYYESKIKIKNKLRR